MADTMPPVSDDGTQARRTRRVGAYAKLLANYASDDALMAAGEAAELLFVRGLAFCATSDADGYITDAQVERYVGAGMKDAMKRALRLCEVGVWQRVTGGFVVRSWLKIHESSVEKGRRRKADRERKARPDFQTDSDTQSVRIPDGSQAEDAPESLSLIHDRTGQDSATTQQSSPSLGEERPETLRALPASMPPLKWTTPSDARCTQHVGVADPGPCKGCRAAREREERQLEREQDKAQREADSRRINCDRCDGYNEVDPDTKLPTKRKCDHERRAAS